ncbi:MAG TPA: hypothetical protein PK961_01705 [bacterium]|nr:hypothetical protein [bacterium]
MNDLNYDKLADAVIEKVKNRYSIKEKPTSSFAPLFSLLKHPLILVIVSTGIISYLFWKLDYLQQWDLDKRNAALQSIEDIEHYSQLLLNYYFICFNRLSYYNAEKANGLDHDEIMTSDQFQKFQKNVEQHYYALGNCSLDRPNAKLQIYFHDNPQVLLKWEEIKEAYKVINDQTKQLKLDSTKPTKPSPKVKSKMEKIERKINELIALILADINQRGHFWSRIFRW